MKKLFLALGTVGGVGYVPVIPGTVGTLLGVVIYLLLSKIPFQPFSYGIILAFVLAAGVWISARCNHYLEGNDNSSIVIDEVGGFLLTMFLLPSSFLFILLGFILFRAFDMTKPFKIEKIEKIRGGWGIMGDDILAGILANLVMQALRSMLGW